MNSREIVALLGAISRISFLRGVMELARSELGSSPRMEICREMAGRLQSVPITDAERSERYLRVLAEARLEGPELRDLAIFLASAIPSIKNAASQVLPEDLRPLLYGHEARAQSVSVQPAILQPNKGPEGKPNQDPLDARLGFDTVVLLATDDQAANIGLLTKSDLAQVKLQKLAAFQEFVRSEMDVCACLFDGSFLRGLAKEQQLEAFEAVFRFSNFIWVRIHRDGLRLSETEIANLHKRVCCEPRGPVAGERLTFSETGSMSESELESIASARHPLQVHRQGRITPGELTPSEATILMAAVSKSILSMTLDAHLEVISLTTKFLPGGRTGAKVAQVKVNSSQVPLIAKIDSKQNVLDEATRFLTFISPADQELRPEIYFHQSTGIIIFGLVPSGGGDAIVPAPTLEQNLRDLWNADVYEDGGAQASSEADAIAAIKSAIGKIKRISKSVMSGGPDSFANPQMKPFKRAEGKGRSWGPPPDAISARGRAETRFAVLESKATTHGDIHLRNILVRAGREAYLIDYARSGPGHPAIDLVRLELALFLSAFKQTADAETLQQLQRAMNRPSTSASNLIEQFAAISQWTINRVCIHGMVEARNVALQVLRVNNGNESDYYAAKYLVAWEALLVSDLQTGLAAAVIASLVDLIP
jgi:Ternary complex associated domain 9